MRRLGIVVVVSSLVVALAGACDGTSGEGEAEGEAEGEGEGDGEGEGEGEGEGDARVLLPSAVVAVPNDLATDVCVWDSTGAFINELAGDSFAVAVNADFIPGGDTVNIRFHAPAHDFDASGACVDPQGDTSFISVPAADAADVIGGHGFFVDAAIGAPINVDISAPVAEGDHEIIVVDDRCKGPLATDVGTWVARDANGAAADVALDHVLSAGNTEVYRGTIAAGTITLVAVDAAGNDAATFDNAGSTGSRGLFVCSQHSITDAAQVTNESRCTIDDNNVGSGVLASIACASEQGSHPVP